MLTEKELLKICWKGIPVENINSNHQINILKLLDKYPNNNNWFDYSATVWRKAFEVKNKYLENLKKDNELAFKQIIKIRNKKTKFINDEVNDFFNQFPVLQEYLK
jgi:hypothetical protein